MLELAPPFAKRVRAANREARFVGMAVPNFFRKPFGPGWALVEDAGYNKDFIHGAGNHRRLPGRRAVLHSIRRDVFRGVLFRNRDGALPTHPRPPLRKAPNTGISDSWTLVHLDRYVGGQSRE
jgi:hypothetical protein